MRPPAALFFLNATDLEQVMRNVAAKVAAWRRLVPI
jgi:hypothetical protein